MKKLLLPIYIILAVMVSLHFFESAMNATATDQIPLFAYAFFSGVIAAALTKRLMRNLRIF